MQLHTQADSWPALSSLHGSAGWLQTEVVEAVNAAEALARHLSLGAAEASRKELAILDAIENLPKRTRAYAAVALEMKRDTLAARLERLAKTIGQSSASWLLGDAQRWAGLVAEVRNALSHGYPTKRRLEKDPNILIAVLTSVRAVQKLAMLRAAGFKNGQTNDVELLADASGKQVIRHTNSSLAAQAISLHKQSDDWLEWSRAPSD